jgi:hypothetical protein
MHAEKSGSVRHVFAVLDAATATAVENGDVRLELGHIRLGIEAWRDASRRRTPLRGGAGARRRGLLEGDRERKQLDARHRRPVALVHALEADALIDPVRRTHVRPAGADHPHLAVVPAFFEHAPQ